MLLSMRLNLCFVIYSINTNHWSLLTKTLFSKSWIVLEKLINLWLTLLSNFAYFRYILKHLNFKLWSVVIIAFPDTVIGIFYVFNVTDVKSSFFKCWYVNIPNHYKHVCLSLNTVVSFYIRSCLIHMKIWLKSVYFCMKHSQNFVWIK